MVSAENSPPKLFQSSLSDLCPALPAIVIEKDGFASSIGSYVEYPHSTDVTGPYIGFHRQSYCS